MANVLDDLMRRALALSEDERKRLADALEASLVPTSNSHDSDALERIERLQQEGRLQEALELAESVLATTTERAWETRFAAILTRARTLSRMGRTSAAAIAHAEALELARANASPLHEGRVELERGSLASRDARRTEAVARCQRALELLASSTDPDATARARLQLGFAYHEAGELILARAEYEQALFWFDENRRDALRVITQMYLGWLALEDGDHERSRELLERAHVDQQRLGLHRLAAATAYCLAHRHLRVGDTTELARVVASGLIDADKPEDRTAFGLICMMDGVLQAQRSELARARARFDEARKTFVNAADAVQWRVLAADTLEGLLDLQEGSLAGASVRLRRVDEQFPDGVAPSSDVRMAAHLLRAKIRTYQEALPTLLLGAGCRWMLTPTGVTADLNRRDSLREIVLALAADVGNTVGWQALFAVGWPGQRASTESQHQRVRTAIWTLRRMGLDAHIETVQSGYRLSDTLRLEWL